MLPLVAAVAAHVVAAALVLRAHHAAAPAATEMASLEEVVVLSTVVAETPNRAPAMGVTEGSHADTPVAPLTRAVGGSRIARHASEPSRETTASEGEAQSGPSPGGAMTLEAPRMVDLGLVGTNRFLPRSEAQTDAFAQNHDRDEILREKPRDRALGLGPEGPVLAALADGTARSLAPVNGSAVFVATTNASGEVVSITLDTTVGERTGWAEAGRLALEGLKGTRLRLPANAQRSVMKLEVVSTWKLPGGHDPGLGVSILTIPIHKGEGKNSAQLDILDIVHPGTISLAPGVQVRGVMVSMDILTVEADPVDVVAKARRVIHTRVLDTTMM